MLSWIDYTKYDAYFYLGTDYAEFTDKSVQIRTGKQCLSVESVPKKKQ